MPATGAVGVNGCTLMTTFPEAAEVHPASMVTVKVYVFAARPEIVVLVPVPEIAASPGVLVKVHVPVEGNPFKITLPVAREQVGWVTVPISGAVGVDGLALITTLAEDDEVHPEVFVTVKVYVPDGISVIVVLVPVPDVIVPPGVLVNVQVPVEGRLLSITLPVPASHVGWVIVPTVGGAGVSRIVIIKVVVVAH